MRSFVCVGVCTCYHVGYMGVTLVLSLCEFVYVCVRACVCFCACVHVCLSVCVLYYFDLNYRVLVLEARKYNYT